MAAKNSGHGEGIELILKEPYEKDGVKGIHTIKHYHLASRVPKVIRRLFPKDAMVNYCFIFYIVRK
jgi:hypothetical protein